MKISNGIRGVLIKKLSEALIREMSLAHFNDAFLYLDKCNRALKIVPYGIFENEDYTEMLTKTDSGKIFEKWLGKTTGNIKTEFNKGRKLVRVFKELVDSNKDNFAFNLSVNSIFIVALTSLFVQEDNDLLEVFISSDDKEQLYKTVELLRNYLAAIFFIDMLTDHIVVENVISLFVNGDMDSLIDDVLKFGLIYHVNVAL
jgi:hypothetical protein